MAAPRILSAASVLPSERWRAAPGASGVCMRPAAGLSAGAVGAAGLPAAGVDTALKRSNPSFRARSCPGPPAARFTPRLMPSLRAGGRSAPGMMVSMRFADWWPREVTSSV